MNQDTFTEVEKQLFQMSKDLVRIASENDPMAFRAAFGGVIANTLGHMPDDYFEELCDLRPCGVPGCDCHLALGQTAVAYFRALRADWQKVMAEKDKEEGRA